VPGSTTSKGGLLGCPTPLAKAYDLALLDLDGVLYIGPDAVPGAPRALVEARRAGLRACFVTNNASRTPSAVAEHLSRLGIPARTDEVVTSAQVASVILARRLPPGAPVLVVGGEGLRVALTERGLRPVRSVDEGPQAVVQGFNPDLSWRDLAEGTRAVRSGLFWMATNLDLTVPTPHGPAPGNGALVGLVAGAAGRQPDAVAGKPRPESFQEAARRYGSSRPFVVGDRLDTDLEGARAAGQDGLLVLTGVSGATDVIGCPAHRRPTYLGRDLTALLQAHPEVDLEFAASGDGIRSRCGQARVIAVDGRLRVEQPGVDALDVLRAAAQVAWAWADRAWADRAWADRAGSDGAGSDGAGADRAGDEPAAGNGAGPVRRPSVVPAAEEVLDALRRLEPGVGWAR
jgi:HAD superfamily hydrolase (TIGR01450 family)